MFEFALRPEVNVDSAEYKRLLGYPSDYVLEGRALELTEWARQWYQEHGRPWIYARQIDDIAATDDGLRIGARRFHCSELSQRLNATAASAIVVAAVSAGPELEAAAQQAWRLDKPDEYFFLEAYGSAVVEHLVTVAGARVCAWADDRQMAVLPHYSPGYGGWDVSEQPRLLESVREGHRLPGPIGVFESGMLSPKKSLLAVFGLTAAVSRAQQLMALAPCERCSYMPCQFRRSDYVHADELGDLELATLGQVIDAITVLQSSQPPRAGHYQVSRKALDRWTNERLTIMPGPDGTINVLFKHEGSTCSNLGRPLHFDYQVQLSSASDGYRILQQECSPAADDVGHRSMCGYLRNPEVLMKAVASEKPLLGRNLDDVLTWRRATGASCYCDTVNRQYMWGQVLETIHYALHREQCTT